MNEIKSSRKFQLRKNKRLESRRNKKLESERHVLDGDCGIAQYKHLQANSRDSHEGKHTTFISRTSMSIKRMIQKHPYKRHRESYTRIHSTTALVEYSNVKCERSFASCHLCGFISCFLFFSSFLFSLSA